MDSKIGFEMNLNDRSRGNTWTMCEFHDSTAPVSEIFGGQTNSSILVVYRIR